MNKINNYKAFTLLEILIVVAIIGLLIGIAIPTFRGIMARGRDAAIKGNMRTIQTTASLIRAERGDFSTVHCNPGGDPEIRAICEKIRANSPHPGQVRSFVTARSFCIQAPLHSRKFWRVDSAGFSGYDLCGYVAYWDMNEGSGTIVHDKSGNANHGTITGATWGTGYLRFDGVDDFVEVPDSPGLRLGKNMTIQAWIKPKANVLDWARLVGKGGSAHRNYGLWRQVDGDILWQIQGATWGQCWNDLGPGDTLNAPVGEWSHIVGTYDGTNMRIFRNGVLGRTCAWNEMPLTSADPVRIGYAGFHTRFNGLIDDVRVYNRALTAEEVYALFRRGR